MCICPRDWGSRSTAPSVHDLRAHVNPCWTQRQVRPLGFGNKTSLGSATSTLQNNTKRKRTKNESTTQVPPRLTVTAAKKSIDKIVAFNRQITSPAVVPPYSLQVRRKELGGTQSFTSLEGPGQHFFAPCNSLPGRLAHVLRQHIKRKQTKRQAVAVR